MCESGRILHHLKNHIGKPTTTVMFSGFQAPNTLGRRILDGEKQIRIFGETYDVRAKVCKLESSSGHADQSQLLDWALKTHQQGTVQNLALVHCELESAEPFRNLLLDHQVGNVLIPSRGEKMPL
jgi:metallo-beta-lactamase family protein